MESGESPWDKRFQRTRATQKRIWTAATGYHSVTEGCSAERVALSGLLYKVIPAYLSYLMDSMGRREF